MIEEDWTLIIELIKVNNSRDGHVDGLYEQKKVS